MPSPAIRSRCSGRSDTASSCTAERPRALLIGGGVGIPPVVFLAERLQERRDGPWQPLVLMGSEIPFPFRAARCREQRCMASPPPTAPACRCSMSGVSQVGLQVLQDFAGCYPRVRDRTCGPVACRRSRRVSLRSLRYLPAVRRRCSQPPHSLARRHGVACQVSLEEFMACAVGGCAGCTVEVSTPDGPAMKRVCVDGPVFDAYTVFPARRLTLEQHPAFKRGPNGAQTRAHPGAPRRQDNECRV